MWTNPWQKGDVEVETYPAVLDGPRNRCIFIRKIYIIIAIQLLVTVAVANTVVSVHPISSFIVHTTAGLAVYVAIIVIPFIGTFFTLFCFSVDLLLCLLCFNLSQKTCAV
jgi:hypothetical protein